MKTTKFKLGKVKLIEEFPVEKILSGNSNSKDKYRYVKKGKHLCFCGNEFIAQISAVKFGKTKSCGCYKNYRIVAGNIKHGMAKSRLSITYFNMLKRCNNMKDPQYKDYGGRGIKVCKKWHKFENFMKWALSNGYTDKLTIDRINNDKNYGPSNCRWVNYHIQATNKRARPNKTGFAGISPTSSGKYAATIFINGKNKSLGSHNTPEEASETYQKAKKERDENLIKNFNKQNKK